ncbi:A24 family peptidase [Bacillus sp. 165]|uniref:prepilin peptidase n=1 Tax=Bacillus sp. 165 TaxID=1529117 RepID=UPI001ADC8B3A|nr:A24 family peptidase [Bacillus sp. 165]MBO9128470.1 prepilin peptidase [Bacillus sp. 165]
MILVYAYIFIVGTALGSFYNVVALRVSVRKSIVTPRSSCLSCGHVLTVLELIPVLSYLMLRGRCKQCGTKISSIYPVFELLTGLLLVLSVIVVGWSLEIIIAWTLVSLFMIIVVSDLLYMLIPNSILLFFSGLFFFEKLFLPFNSWWDSVIGLTAGFGILSLIAIVSRGGMGGGDIKLFALLGFVLGWKIVMMSLILSLFFGSLFGVIGLLTGHVKKREPMPFGPYIMLGTLCAYFFGYEIMKFYSSFLLLS